LRYSWQVAEAGHPDTAAAARLKHPAAARLSSRFKGRWTNHLRMLTLRRHSKGMALTEKGAPPYPLPLSVPPLFLPFPDIFPLDDARASSHNIAAMGDGRMTRARVKGVAPGSRRLGLFTDFGGAQFG